MVPTKARSTPHLALPRNAPSRWEHDDRVKFESFAVERLGCAPHRLSPWPDLINKNVTQQPIASACEFTGLSCCHSGTSDSPPSGSRSIASSCVCGFDRCPRFRIPAQPPTIARCAGPQIFRCSLSASGQMPAPVVTILVRVWTSAGKGHAEGRCASEARYTRSPSCAICTVANSPQHALAVVNVGPGGDLPGMAVPAR